MYNLIILVQVQKTNALVFNQWFVFIFDGVLHVISKYNYMRIIHYSYLPGVIFLLNIKAIIKHQIQPPIGGCIFYKFL